MIENEAGQETYLNKERFKTIIDTFVELPAGTSLMLYRRMEDGQLIGCVNVLDSDDQIWEVMLVGASSMATAVRDQVLVPHTNENPSVDGVTQGFLDGVDIADPSTGPHF